MNMEEKIKKELRWIRKRIKLSIGDIKADLEDLEKAVSKGKIDDAMFPAMNIKDTAELILEERAIWCKLKELLKDEGKDRKRD